MILGVPERCGVNMGHSVFAWFADIKLIHLNYHGHYGVCVQRRNQEGLQSHRPSLPVFLPFQLAGLKSNIYWAPGALLLNFQVPFLIEQSIPGLKDPTVLVGRKDSVGSETHAQEKLKTHEEGDTCGRGAKRLKWQRLITRQYIW